METHHHPYQERGSYKSDKSSNTRKKEKARKEVFIGGLPLTTNLGKKSKLTPSIDEVRSYLLRFGPLRYCRLAMANNGSLKGFGFAEFLHEHDAQKSCGKNHKIRNKTVSLEFV